MPVTSLWVTFRFAHLNLCFFRSFWHVAHRLIWFWHRPSYTSSLSWLTDLRALLWLSWVIMSHDCQRSWTDLVPACPNFLTCSHYCNDTSEFRAQFYAVVSGIPLGHGVGTDGRVRLQFSWWFLWEFVVLLCLSMFCSLVFLLCF